MNRAKIIPSKQYKEFPIHIPKDFIERDMLARNYGKQAFIYRNPKDLKLVCDYYGRDPKDLCIKVFYGNPLAKDEKLEDALWGDNPDLNNPNEVRKNTKLMEGSKIHNILWWHGLSTRVYAVFEIDFKGKRVACQLTDFLKDDFYTNQKYITAFHDQQLTPKANQYHFSEVKDIMGIRDVMEDKVVDVQQYAFDDDIEKKMVEDYVEKGRYGKVYYQDVPELGLSGGPRKSADRIKYMQLDKIDFKDKIVWDVGCAGGFFCRYAIDRGAKRVFGFDEPTTIESAFILSNYLGYFNIDYKSVDLSKGIPNDIPKPDIAFYLSMIFHIPTPDRLYEADTLIFEDNGKETRDLDKLDKPWTDHYPNIEFIGRASDHGDKAIYHLKK